MHTEICPLQKSQKICANFFFCRFDFNKWSRSKFLKSSENSELNFLEFGRQKKDQTRKLLKLNASISRIFSNSFFAKVFLNSYLFFHKINTLVFQKRSILILKLEDFRWLFIVLRIPPFMKNKTIETSDLKAKILEISVARKFRAENTKGEPQNTEKKHHFENQKTPCFWI